MPKAAAAVWCEQRINGALHHHGLDRRFAPESRRDAADNDFDPLLGEAALEKGRNLRHVEFPEQCVALEQRDFDAFLPQRSRDLQADEAATDHHGLPGLLRTRTDGFGIIEASEDRKRRAAPRRAATNAWATPRWR